MIRASLRVAAMLSASLLPSLAHAQATASSFTSTMRYDALQRVVGTIAPDPDDSGPLHYAAVRNTYDGAGRLTKVETGELAAWQDETVAPATWSGFSVMRVVDMSYDASGRKIGERRGSGGTPLTVSHYSYDGDDRLVCEATRMNPAQWNGQSDACTPQQNGSNGADRITRTLYDGASRIVQVRRAVGTSLEQAYATYSYTADGKKQDVVDANGNRAHMAYDVLDRQTQWQFPSASVVSGFDGSTPDRALATAGSANANDYEGYGYDANGNRTNLRKRDGRSFGFVYDALNRVTSKSVPDGCAPIQVGACAPGAATRDVYYGYDLRGLQLSARFDGANGGDGITNGYDGLGRLTSSATAMGGTNRQITFAYDADGDRTQVGFPDGQTFGYQYDGLDRNKLVQQPDGSGLASLSFDALGQHRSTGRLNGTSTFWDFDAVGRLGELRQNASAGTYLATDFTYNPASQVFQKTTSNDAYAWTGASNANTGYVANGLNQYASVGGAGFGYDANGNLTSDGTTTYVYDAENRLVGASNGTSLTYDPNGRLWQITGGPSGTTQFLYDGDQLSAEYDGSGNLLRRYIHGTDEDDPLVWYEGGGLGNPRYLHADHQGSIVSISDANGNTSAINSYDEYGVPANGNQGRFQYTGQAWLPDLNLYHYKARVYSPKLGRMLQTDPVGYKDQVNLYAYVANDPVNATDPTGLYDCSSKDACSSAEQGRAQIKAARDYYASAPTGSLISRNAAAATALSGVLNDLGTKGDHNGLTVSSGKVDGGARGDYLDTTRTITLNKAEITASGGRIGETLGHEVEHDRLRAQFLPGSYVEARPLGIQYLLGRAPGGSLTGFGGGQRGYVVDRLRGYIGRNEHLGGPVGEQRAQSIYDQEQWKPF